MTEASISLIIPCYTMDRFRDITELLDSVWAQTYKNIETMIVVERSPELAESIRQYIGERSYNGMRVLYREGPWGVSASRNLGASQAQGNIIAFVDDDALLFPNWAEELVKTYDGNSSVIGVTGSIIPLWEEDSMKWFPREFYWIFSCTYWDMTENTEVRNGYSTNLSFRQEAFKKVAPFRTTLGVKGRGQEGWQEPGAEEVEFSLRLRQKTGKRIIYNPNVKVQHKVYKYRMTSKFIARRTYWEGYAKALMTRLHNSSSSKDVLSVEWALLRRILFRLLPKTIGHLFHQPLIALRRLWLILAVLSCVFTGYITCKLTSLFGWNNYEVK